jgi:hypothetical protein
MGIRLRRLPAVLAVLLVAGIVSACATIMHGSSQELSVASTPTGATVLVDGMEAGKTPFVANLKRKDKHVVRIEMPGYQPFEMPIVRATSGWVWGNLVFGALPGLAIDAITGGLYKLKPDEVNATLAANTASVASGNDYLVVAVVLRPEAGWEKVGQLQGK